MSPCSSTWIITRREASNYIRIKFRITIARDEKRGRKERGTHGDGSSLYDEARQVKPQLALARERDAGGDHDDDEREPAVDLLDAERPADEEDRDGVERLEHLDVVHGEVQVRLVAQDERAREQQPDRHDRPQERVPRDVHVLRAVHEVRRALQRPRADGLEK